MAVLCGMQSSLKRWCASRGCENFVLHVAPVHVHVKHCPTNTLYTLVRKQQHSAISIDFFNTNLENHAERTTNYSIAGLIKSVSIVYREDLDLKNHLAGHQRKLMKIAFDNTQALMEVRIELMPSIARNRANAKRSDAYSVLTSLSSSSGPAASAAVRLSLRLPLFCSGKPFTELQAESKADACKRKRRNNLMNSTIIRMPVSTTSVLLWVSCWLASDTLLWGVEFCLCYPQKLYLKMCELFYLTARYRYSRTSSKYCSSWE